MNQRTFHLALMAILGLLVWSSSSHSAQDNPNPAPQSQPDQAQVKSFVGTAVNYIKAHGKKAAFTEFNKPNGAFVKGLTYVFIVDYKGVVLADGGDPTMVGTIKYDDKDIKGNYIIRDMLAKAKKGGGWVSYYWNDPVSKKVGCKSSYVVSIQDQYVVSSGYYHAPDAKGDCTVSE